MDEINKSQPPSLLTDYQNLVESIPVVFYIIQLGEGGKVLSRYVSPYVQKMLGYAPDEFSLPDDLWKSILHPDDTQRVHEEILAAIQNHHSLNTEYRLKDKEGKWVWIQDRAFIYYNNQKQPIMLQGSQVEITSQNEVNPHSLTADTRFVGPYENLPVGYQSLDYDGNILEVNSTWLKMMGYQKWEVLGKWFGDFLETSQVDLFRERFPRFKEIGQVTGVEFIMRRKDGTTFPVSFTGRIRRDVKGDFIKTHCVLQDITLSKTIELQLKESEEKFYKVFMVIPEMILITRFSDGVILDANESFYRITGYSKEEVIGKPLIDLDLWLFPEKRAAYIDQIINTGECLEYESVIQKKDKTQIPILLSGRMMDIRGIPSIISIARDISQLKKTEEERMKLESRILQTQKLESLGVLAGGIAHDFNNLLTGILGNAEMFRQDLEPASTEYERIKQIEIAAQRAADLTRQMLAYSGKGKYLNQNIYLPDLIGQMNELIQVSLDKNTQFSVEAEEKLPLIYGDSAQIQQLLMNLILNASESITGKSGRIKLKVEQSFLSKEELNNTEIGMELPEGNYVCVTVNDNGSGMTPEVLKHAFEPFYTTKFTGRGLGLPAVLGIVKSHKGTLKVESEPGVGTQSMVCFPVLQSQPMTHTLFTDDTGGYRTGSVLLLDDEEMVLNLTRRFLEKAGFHVVEYTQPQPAIETFSQSPDKFPLAIIDINLPLLSGFEVAQKLRSLRQETRFLFTSGLFKETDYQMQKEIPNSQLIQKPFRYQDLVEKVKSILSE